VNGELVSAGTQPMKVVHAEPLIHAEPLVHVESAVIADRVHLAEPLVHVEPAVIADRVVHAEPAVLPDRVLHPDPGAQADPVSAGIRGSAAWMRSYLRRLLVADCACALAAGVLAVEIRFVSQGYLPLAYLAFTGVLPALWWGSVMLAGGYDPRFIGLGSDEFRKVLNAAMCLAAGVAIASYTARLNLARGYLAVALPSATALDLMVRYLLRKRLHRSRSRGACTRRVVAAGHAAAVADLVTTLHRDRYHGLSVVAACVPDLSVAGEVANVPVAGELSHVPLAVRQFGADTVAVLSCPEMDGKRLRELAWELEKTGTDLCVAPALLDVAGPRTTIRPVAGLPLLHVDHAELAGGKQVLKGVFDKVSAALALILLAPVLAGIAAAIRVTGPGPVLFRQIRVGRDGRCFTLYKFRTMVADAEQQKALLAASNEADGALFKIRRDPRITPIGGWLRRWSLDELPQLLNVLRGDMSLVGPRPALPDETARYGDHMRRRLVVKPGITGLWQVSGRSDLAWEEAVRLDLRYVENWSLALDLQILWKTGSAVFGGSGAY
jgi:exopolysaccharide biosynthesis polyprenyl glycosylphosphotransferase